MESYRRFAHDRMPTSQIFLAVILVDISISMKQSDWPPSRLHGAMAAVEGLLDLKHMNYPNDLVGMVGFSQTASVLQPLVSIGGEGRRIFRTDPAMIQTGPSTNMSAGLSLAGGILAEAVRNLADPYLPPALIDRQIILLTDGEHNDGPEPVPLARELQQSGIVLDVIGIGTPSEIDHTCARTIASERNGRPSYCFVGDVGSLIVRMTQLAHHHIRPL